MKFAVLTLLSGLSLFSYSQRKKVDVAINYAPGNCKHETSLSAAAAMPYSDKTIIIVTMKGRVDSVRTSKDGHLRLKLRKGTYFLFEPWRYNLYTPFDLPLSAFDRACMITEWQKYLFTVTVLRRSYKAVQNNLLLEMCEENIPCLLNKP